MEKNPTWIPVVALALGRSDGRWLMHRRPAGKAHAGLWEFPGGKVDAGEHPVIALIREIEEEVSISLAPVDLHPAGFAQAEPGGHSAPIVILLYDCRQWRGDPAALEGGELGWFTPPEIALLDKPPLDVELARQLFSKTPP